MIKKRRQFGFSLLELMIVVSIGLVLMAMVTPLVTTALNMYRLRGAGGEYANLLQTARIRAVTADRYYPVYAPPGLPGAAGANTFNAFVDLNGTASYAMLPLGDPAVSFNAAIVIQPQGNAPNTVNLYTQFLPGIAVGAVQINPNPWGGPAFGPRGLPCYAAAPPGGTCTYTFPTAGGAQVPVAFETFMQNTRTGMWEAVTVNPSGRVIEWHYNVGTGTWQALN